jgi:hypothetical protein
MGSAEVAKPSVRPDMGGVIVLSSACNARYFRL